MEAMTTTEILVSPGCKAKLEGLPRELGHTFLRKIELLAGNPRHPSLNAHSLHRSGDGLWECYISDNYRLIYQPIGLEIRLWDLGPHSIVDRFRGELAPPAVFQLLFPQGEEKSEEEGFQIPSSWYSQQDGVEPDYPFAQFRTTHLRILGVPENMAKAVRHLPSLELLEELPLPPSAQQMLLDIATSSRLAPILRNPDELFYRTTLERLEGYVQGHIKDLMLNLSEEQRRIVEMEAKGDTLLRGAAGSGKTTILVYRAIRLAERGDQVLLLTYNRTLAQAMRTLVESQVGPLPPNLVIQNLDAYLMGLLRDVVPNLLRPIVQSGQQREFIRTALERARAEADGQQRFEWMTLPSTRSAQSPGVAFKGLSETNLQNEIVRVIKSNGLESWDEYLAFPRYGRKQPLREGLRRSIWSVYLAYQKILVGEDLLDWPDLSLLALRYLDQHPQSPRFDAVLVDEAQDFTLLALKAVQHLVREGENHSLFLVGDLGQTIYSRGFTWRQAGLKVKGRSRSLRRNYRNTVQIAQAAKQLGECNLILKDSGEYVDPEFSARQGNPPLVLSCSDEDACKGAVYEEILHLSEEGLFQVGDSAVICPTNEMGKQFQQYLNARGLQSAVHTDSGFDILDARVKILTIHSAKGLEFPVVFVVGLTEGRLPRSHHGELDEEEAAIALEQDRILLYVAMTRAAEMLYLVTCRNKASRFLGELSGMVLQRNLG